MNSVRLCLLIGLICVPQLTHGAVLFHEVAWMGTSEDANNEWIELFNDGQNDVVVDGWTITDNTALSITLSGTIPAQASVVLERTDDTTLPDISAFLTYTGALSNDGRTLTLVRADGGTEDRVVGGEGWALIGGSNETKETPQRVGGSWVTAPATPGSKRESGGSETGTQNTQTNNSVQGGTQQTNVQSKAITNSRGGGGSVKKPLVPGVLELGMSAPTIAYVNQEVVFEAVPQGVGPTIKNSLSYVWNFGDGNSESGKRTTHTFAYPGEYVVYLEGEFARQHAEVRHEIKVLSTSFEITTTKNGDVQITNKAPYETDLSNFTLTGTKPFTFPDHTYIKRDATITIPREKVGNDILEVSLFDTQTAQVATYRPVTESALGRVSGSYTVRASLPQKSEMSGADIKMESDDTVTIVEPIASPGIIQIGAPQEPKKSGFISRIFQKISGLFGGI